MRRPTAGPLLLAAALLVACGNAPSRIAAPPSPSPTSAAPTRGFMPAGDVYPLQRGSGQRTLGRLSLDRVAYLYFACAGGGKATVQVGDLTRFTTGCGHGGERSLEKLEAATYPREWEVEVSAAPSTSWELSVDAAQVEFPG